MGFIIIIPARFFSTRFPAKLLADMNGKPMIIRVIEKALTTTANKVIIATDNNIIVNAVESEYGYAHNKIEICLTQSTHRSGTERLFEVVKRYEFSDNQCIVQLQADEPLISSNMIDQVVKSLYLHSDDVSVTTLATPIQSLEEANDKNIVKVVVNSYNHALYFSRSEIPWCSSHSDINIKNYLLHHVGIYSYYVNFLYRYIKWSPSLLEQLEMLEQLRVLWYGEKIHVSVIDTVSNISVNTPKSLQQANKILDIIN